MDLNTMWTVGSAIGGVVVTCIGFFMKSILTNAKVDRDQMWTRVNEIDRKQSNFETRVAENYVSVETFRNLEKAVLDAIKDLGAKVDRMFFRDNGSKS